MRVLPVLIVVLAACGAGDVIEESPDAPTPTAVPTEGLMPDGCADVVGVEVVEDGDGTFTFHVTVASADTGWEKYADEWTVQAPDGMVLGTRTLTHPHDDEQPFTRSLSGVQISEGVSTVVVAARDSVEGYCGSTVEIAVP